MSELESVLTSCFMQLSLLPLLPCWVKPFWIGLQGHNTHELSEEWLGRWIEARNFGENHRVQNFRF